MQSLERLQGAVTGMSLLGARHTTNNKEHNGPKQTAAHRTHTM